MTSAAKTRCSWVGDDPLYIDYHDTEWGVPVYDHRALFEKLILDGFQAGLAWITILRKRDNFIAAFAGFRPELIAAYGPDKVEPLMADAGIVRNRAWLELMERDGGFSGFLWDFVDGRPMVNRWPAMNQVPSETNESKNMSKTLKSLGFKFCGPTICYAFMQAVGMVNDHTTDCFRHGEV